LTSMLVPDGMRMSGMRGLYLAFCVGFEIGRLTKE